MGCCGYDLHVSTTIAALIGILLSLFGITWTTILYVIFVSNNDATEIVFKVFNSSLILNKADLILVGLYSTSVSLALHALWLFVSVLLLAANYKHILFVAKMWIGISSIIIITDITAALYFVLQTGEAWRSYLKDSDMSQFGFCVMLTVLFSKFGTIFHAVLVFQISFVSMRCKEIAKEKELQKRRNFPCYTVYIPKFNCSGSQSELLGEIIENENSDETDTQMVQYPENSFNNSEVYIEKVTKF